MTDAFPTRVISNQGILVVCEQMCYCLSATTYQCANHRILSSALHEPLIVRLYLPSSATAPSSPFPLLQYDGHVQTPEGEVHNINRTFHLDTKSQTFSVLACSSSTLACSAAEAVLYSSRRWYAANVEAKEKPNRNPIIL